MDAARHLEILRTEGERLASMPAESLDAPVPAVDDWTMEVVVRHTGKVHQRVTRYLSQDPDKPLSRDVEVPGIPKGPDCLPAYREALEAILAKFAELDLSRPATTFVGQRDVAWWARRQAQEVSVHRMDCSHAVHFAGGPAPEPLPIDGAADGIDEWARIFLAGRFAQRFGPLPEPLHGRSVHIHGTDDPAPADGAEWLLSFGPDGVEVEATHAEGDVALRGPAEQLLLALWRRRPLDSLDIVGDRSVAEQLHDVARF